MRKPKVWVCQRSVKGALAALAVLASTACGQTQLTKPQFISKGDKLCEKFDRESKRLRPAGNPFRPDPTPGELQEGTRFLTYFAVHLPELAGDLRGLGGPKNDSSLELGLRILDRSGGHFAEAKRLLSTGDTQGAKGRLDKAFGELEQAALATDLYGFKTCGATQGQSMVASSSGLAGPRAEVSATEYAFVAPSQLAPGPNTFVLTNIGKQRHFLALTKLKDKVTAQQVIDADRGGDGAADLVEKQIGQSPPVLPGRTVNFNAELEPGTYEYACFIAAPDGELHAFKGMFGELTVAGPVAPAVNPSPLPSALPPGARA